MITIKTKKELDTMREGGKILALLLQELAAMVKPGLNILEFEKKAKQFIKENNAEPAFLGYKKYPNILCVSINEQLVHCQPSNRKLKDGDIVSIDTGMKYKGLYTDSALTVPVGEISKQAKKLVSVT